MHFVKSFCNILKELIDVDYKNSGWLVGVIGWLGFMAYFVGIFLIPNPFLNKKISSISNNSV